MASSSLGLSGVVIKSVLKRPSVPNGSAEPVAPTVATVTSMSAIGVRRASFSRVSWTMVAPWGPSRPSLQHKFSCDGFQGLCVLAPRVHGGTVMFENEHQPEPVLPTVHIEV